MKDHRKGLKPLSFKTGNDSYNSFYFKSSYKWVEEDVSWREVLRISAYKYVSAHFLISDRQIR